MEQLTLNPISRVEGCIHLPGSKSLSNRALLLAALANGTTKVTNLLDSDDVRHMLNALKHLGVNYRLSEDESECEVQGLGAAFEWQSGLALFLGNAGTAMRPLFENEADGGGLYQPRAGGLGKSSKGAGPGKYRNGLFICRCKDIRRLCPNFGKRAGRQRTGKLCPGGHGKL